MLRSPDQLIAFVSRWQRRKIVVAGDFMLDHYIYGHADRLSPDAPVPVLSVQRQEHKPGGAANVCLDLLALHCDVVCLGVVGRDDNATLLRRQLEIAGCDVSGLVNVDDRPTTVKQNLVGLAQHRHPQKMFRVDLEKKLPIDDQAAQEILKQAAIALQGASALCLEDYNKGVLTPDLCRQLIELARSMNVPVMVDPAAISDYRKYTGAATITPNRTEASLATDIKCDGADQATLETLGRKLLDSLKLDTVVLTLDKQGAMLLERDKTPVLVPTVARQVYDVTGAGDMVLAMLAAARANGADWLTAVELANVAAGLEVERFGVVPIELDEIMLSLLQQQSMNLGKIRQIEQLLPELAAYRKQGRKIAFTNGCFDILHAGHVSFLREARALGDILVVGVNSDDSIRRIKGPERPVNQQSDRLMVLSELESISYLVVFDKDTPEDLLQAIRPDVLVKGGDYSRDGVVGGDFVESYGGKVEVVGLVKGRSTTNIIGKIRQQ